MLGNFHTIMYLLGCVGNLIGGSGTYTILSKIYSENVTEKLIRCYQASMLQSFDRTFDC